MSCSLVLRRCRLVLFGVPKRSYSTSSRSAMVHLQVVLLTVAIETLHGITDVESEEHVAVDDEENLPEERVVPPGAGIE
jgi:hypothetical protein